MTIWRDKGRIDPEAYAQFGLPPRQIEDAATKRKLYTWLVIATGRGSQLPDVAGLQKGFHYRGDGPWFSEVQTSIIASIAMKEVNIEEISNAQMMKAFKSIVGKKIKCVNRLVPLRNSRGELHLRPRVSFVQFAPVEQYKEIIRDIEQSAP